MAYPTSRRRPLLVPLLFLILPACTVLGDEPPDLDEIEAVRTIEIDASAVTPANCGHWEVLEIEITNTSGRDLTAWPLYSMDWWVQLRPAQPVQAVGFPRVLGPGESTHFEWAEPTYDDPVDVLSDITGAQVFASNMDPSDPEPPPVMVSHRNRCEPRETDWITFAPVGLDPAGVTNARQALSDITPSICPLSEYAEAVVENRSGAEATVWAGFATDVATISEEALAKFGGRPVTIFSPPVRLAPGEQTTLRAAGSHGTDLTEMAVMSDGAVPIAGDPPGDLAVAWLDTCVN